ncbi:HDIG domain-containing protein [Oscillatoria sp. CS-180]|uniref:HD family phosphohydrolase n=1 Tax=Oscillatoria sp. CS-180 TaxID=3021720 RepID=UPI00232DE24C|nr:HDIG domain-containing metalloprotein [Oscillatoria sp. CS-180]MDB9528067.1 HDIG domain-containing protein [Oscillatoria sp. CS-180]
MKKIWQWIQGRDNMLRPLEDQDTQFKAGYSLEPPTSKRNIKYLQELSRSWDWRKPRRFFAPQLPLPPSVKRNRLKSSPRQRVRPAIALSVSVLALTAAMGQRYYRQPELQVGTVSPKTAIAPYSDVVVDQETTEAQRTAARNGAIPVLVPDPDINQQVQNSLDSLFEQANILRKQTGEFPLLPSSELSTTTQTYLREAPTEEWSAVWSIVTAVAVDALETDNAQTSLNALLTGRDDYRELNTQQQRAARELIRYQQLQSPMDLEGLQIIIESARTDFRRALTDLRRLTQAERGLPYDPTMFRLSEKDWKTVQQQVSLNLEQMLLQGVAEGVPMDLLEIAVDSRLRGAVSTEAHGLAKELLVAVLEPNLVKDPEKTRAKAEAAADQVPEVTIPVQSGEIIIRQGEEIDQTAFVLLDHFNLSQRRLNVWGLVGYGVLMSGGVALFLLVERTVRPGLRRQDHVLILCMLLGVSGLSILGFAVYSLPALGLLTSSFYGATLGSSLVGLVALLLPIGTRINTIPLLASAAGGLVCSLVAPQLRSREELALLGGIVGVIQGAVYLGLTWLMSPVSLTTWYLPLTGAILQGFYGVVSSVVALGLSPYLEHLFDLVTPIRLAELSSPNRPMLQRLASEAPGTFQHTLFVASLAEAAARALCCNVELVRAGTLYHDIGKMHDPLGFIENQMGGPNKHDEINDPWVSADIIKKHVSEGTVMARRCRLPKAVRAFIPEHQGTMQISFFHHKAMEMAKAEPNISVKEEDFRYPGPIPQSPETGIVMLADSCEAALRSLKEASPSEALAMVNRILKARWRDGQLVDSGLTREHMSIIAQVFVQVWQQYNHKRIAYPKSVLNPVAGRS